MLICRIIVVLIFASILAPAYAGKDNFQCEILGLDNTRIGQQGQLENWINGDGGKDGGGNSSWRGPMCW